MSLRGGGMIRGIEYKYKDGYIRQKFGKGGLPMSKKDVLEKIAAECCGSCEHFKYDSENKLLCTEKDSRYYGFIMRFFDGTGCDRYTPRNPIENPLKDDVDECLKALDMVIEERDEVVKAWEELKEFNDQLLKTNKLIAKEHKATKKMWEELKKLNRSSSINFNDILRKIIRQLEEENEK